MDSKAFCDLTIDSTTFHWINEHEKLLQSIKDRVSEGTIPAVPSTDYPFHVHVDSSNVCTRCILTQTFPKKKESDLSIVGSSIKLCRKCLLFTKIFVGYSRLYKRANTILSVLHHRSAYCDHKWGLYLWGHRGQISHCFFSYQVIIAIDRYLNYF